MTPPPPPHSSPTDDDDDAGAIGSRRTGETGLVVTESAGPGADSIICTVRPPHEPASVGRIRREIVADLQTRDLPDELVDEAELVASELVTNALRHARPLSDGTIRVRWKIRGDVVEVEVTDGGGESVPRPAPRSVWLSASGGVSRSMLTCTERNCGVACNVVCSALRSASRKGSRPSWRSRRF